mmetsp:Transcript_37173/g.114812  ORF Transcript_37173/g.114812 Transcript_37173/m.114812 type:complete len:209 (-) Transcript_37173:144-770(-)
MAISSYLQRSATIASSSSAAVTHTSGVSSSGRGGTSVPTESCLSVKESPSSSACSGCTPACPRVFLPSAVWMMGRNGAVELSGFSEKSFCGRKCRENFVAKSALDWATRPPVPASAVAPKATESCSAAPSFMPLAASSRWSTFSRSESTASMTERCSAVVVAAPPLAEKSTWFRAVKLLLATRVMMARSPSWWRRIAFGKPRKALLYL